MGIYSLYIWPCYLLFVVMLSAHLIFAWRQQRSVRAKIISGYKLELSHD